MRKYLILLTLITFYSSSQESLSLEQAIEYGISNSHDIAIVKNDANIIKNNNHLGATGMLPNITISSGYNFSGIVVDSLRPNPLFFPSSSKDNNQASEDFGSEDYNQYIGKFTFPSSQNFSSSINLNYRLFNGFSGIYTLSKFNNQNSIADESIRSQIESKIMDVISQYYDLLNNQNIYETFKTRYNISLDRYNQTLEKHELGSVSTRELLNIEVLLNEDQIKMDEAAMQLKSSKLNLALSMGVSEKEFFIEYEFSFNTSLKIKELLEKAKRNNSSIIMAELNYRVAQDELKISKSNYLPKVDFVSSYSYNIFSETLSQFSEIRSGNLSGGFNISIPIFSANIRNKTLQNAKINLDSKSHYLEDINSAIKTALLNAYYAYIDGLSNLELMEKNLDTAEKNYKISKELYEMGQLSNIEYREAQLQLDQIQINYSIKLSNTKIQEYIIYQLSGQLNTK